MKFYLYLAVNGLSYQVVKYHHEVKDDADLIGEYNSQAAADKEGLRLLLDCDDDMGEME